jgi:hypothetical protein
VKIGLPDTLRYHRYGPWWESFLTTLGLEVVKPELTLEDAFNQGAKLMPEEAPTVQLFVGRVLEIAPLVDALITPDLNPGAEPGERGASTDPWAVDLGTVLSRRLSLPPLHTVPARLDPTETSHVAIRLGQVLAQNVQLVRRALDRTQSGLRAPRVPEPSWARAGKKTVGVIGEPTLLEQPFLWAGLRAKLEHHGLHPVFASDLPRERLLELGRARRPDLLLETDLETVGGAAFLEGKGQARGLIALVQPRAQMQAVLGAEIVKKAHKPAVVLELDGDLDGVLAAFSAQL